MALFPPISTTTAVAPTARATLPEVVDVGSAGRARAGVVLARTLKLSRALTRSARISDMARSKRATTRMASCGSMRCSLTMSSRVSTSVRPMLDGRAPHGQQLGRYSRLPSPDGGEAVPAPPIQLVVVHDRGGPRGASGVVRVRWMTGECAWRGRQRGYVGRLAAVGDRLIPASETPSLHRPHGSLRSWPLLGNRGKFGA